MFFLEELYLLRKLIDLIRIFCNADLPAPPFAPLTFSLFIALKPEWN